MHILCLIKGHVFKARHTMPDPILFGATMGATLDLSHSTNAVDILPVITTLKELREATYLGDRCERCGNWAKQKQ